MTTCTASDGYAKEENKDEVFFSLSFFFFVVVG